MAKTDYLPNQDAAFDEWLENFNSQLGTVFGQVGVTAAELGEQGTLGTTWDTEFNQWTAKDAEAKQQRAKKDAARAAWETKGRPLVRRIKAHPGYTEAIGELLKVVGSEDPTPQSLTKPKLTIKLGPSGQVEIAFAKGNSDGVNIYSKREADGALPVFLARDTQSPYIDNRPLTEAGKPEKRTYHAVYVVDDAETGQKSDEVTVTVG